MSNFTTHPLLFHCSSRQIQPENQAKKVASCCIRSARKVEDINVNQKVASLSEEVLSAYSGPDEGIANLDEEDIPGCRSWTQRRDNAYGMAFSLYERDVNSSKEVLCGDPVADVFAVVNRENSTFLAVADGVSWGHKPKLAAKCAVHATMATMSRQIAEMKTVKDIFAIMNSCLWDAQRCILRHKATLTTLSVAAIVQLSGQDKWAACTMQIGDSPIFVYKETENVILELAPCEDQVKCLIDSGGCLGPLKGDDPDLSNLKFCYIPVAKNDIVFITSDGIADNYRTGCLDKAKKGEKDCLAKNLFERVNSVRQELQSVNNYHFSAQDLCACLCSQAKLLTDELRSVRETMQEKQLTKRSLPQQDPELYGRYLAAPGKLDHACIAAFEVR